MSPAGPISEHLSRKGADPALRRARVMVVDDDPIILEAWTEILSDRYEVSGETDFETCKSAFSRAEIDLALVDMNWPNQGDGLDLLQALFLVQPLAEGIIVSGSVSIDKVVNAMRAGAFDVLSKPITDWDKAFLRIEAALERKKLRETNLVLQERVEALETNTRLIGETPAMHRLKDLIHQLAGASAPTLILGESGTGKELVARALHMEGNRASGPMVTVNCAAIAPSLIDAELFGYLKGAFTGAASNHKGLFDAADKGTLFLDEIGDVPLETQVRLLRALENGEIRPVGSAKSHHVNVRVIAATNVDLPKAMADQRFRADLFYRISAHSIQLAPLRDRVADIPLLTKHLLEKFSRRVDRRCPTFSDQAMRALKGYGWPGNIRELANVVEHAATMSSSDVVALDCLPAFVTVGRWSLPPASRISSIPEPYVELKSTVPYAALRAKVLHDFDREYAKNLLRVTDGNLSEASRRSGIDRTNLRRMLKRLGVAP